MVEINVDRYRVDQISLTFQRDLMSGDDTITPFLSVLKKIYKECNKAGFKKMFTKKEVNVILEIYEQIFPDGDESITNQNVQILGDNNAPGFHEENYNEE